MYGCKKIKLVSRRLDRNGREVIAPATDICERADHYLVHCDMPGLERDEIFLELKGGVLLLRAEFCQEPPQGMRIRALEFSHSIYQLSLAVPPDVDAEGLSASYKDGVLAITAPRKPSVLGREVRVQTD